MRNYITPDHSAWPDAALQASFPSKAASSNQFPELVHDDHAAQAATVASEMQGQSVPSCGFEGFGSFC